MNVKTIYKLIQATKLIKKDKNGKAYEALEIDYKEDGKAATHTLYPFGSDEEKARNREMAEFVLSLKAGEEFQVTKEKNERGYWNWTDAGPVGEGASEKEPEPAPRVKPGFVPDDKRQLLIVRQSSLGHAIEFAKATLSEKGFNLDDVLAIATTMESFVFNGAPKKGVAGIIDTKDDFDDDIPY